MVQSLSNYGSNAHIRPAEKLEMSFIMIPCFFESNIHTACMIISILASSLVSFVSGQLTSNNFFSKHFRTFIFALKSNKDLWDLTTGITKKKKQ